MFDDLPGLRWDSVGENHLELHHQVASLGGAFGHRKPLASEPPHSSRFDHIAAGERHHPAVQSRDVYRAAAESLRRKRRRTY